MREYTKRSYRSRLRPKGLACFEVAVRETDLWVCADSPLHQQVRDLVFALRHQLEAYLASHPGFSDSLLPLEEDPYAPPLVRKMMEAGLKAKVGPMAAVAGAIAQGVGEGLLQLSRQVIVENGGDIFMKMDRPVTVAIFAGTSALSGRVGLLIHPHQMPLGLCSSSGTVGHSLSQGVADAVSVAASSAALADSAATALGNRIKKREDLPRVAEWANEIGGIVGGVAILKDAMATWGDIELVAL